MYNSAAPNTPQSPDRRRDPPAAQQVVHPELLERARFLRRPLVRQGFGVHRPVHRLFVGHRLPHRSRRRGAGRRDGLGHPVGPDVQGRHVDPRRLPRGHLDGAPAQGQHRHQHHRRDADRAGRRRSARTRRPDEHQGQHRGLQGHPRGCDRPRPHLERRHARRRLLRTCRRAPTRRCSAGGTRPTASAWSTTTA